MKANQQSETRIIGALLFVLGLLLAALVGGLVGQGYMFIIIGVAGVVCAIAVALGLQQNIWLLMPVSAAFVGGMPILPVPFAVRDLVTLLVFTMMLFLYAFKIPRWNHRLGWHDLFIWLNMAYLAVILVRHPVGVAALGAKTVGGRHVFNIFLGFITYWVLSHIVVRIRTAKILPWLFTGGALAESLLAVSTILFPSITPYVFRFYSGVGTSAYLQELEGTSDQRFKRYGPLSRFGTILSRALTARYNPISLILPTNTLPFLAFLVAIGAILLSGFRSAFVQVGFFFLIATYYHGGIRDVIKSAGLGLILLTFLVAGQGSLFELPRTAQRTLSFLPADWNERAIRDAKDSSEWRFKMWEEILTSEDEWIKNWYLGDGFGFSARELKIIQNAALIGARHEAQLIMGAFHSGPLSAIRVAGYIGLLVFFSYALFQVFFVLYLLKRARGTPFQFFALFLALPILYFPLEFIFIFGDYKSDLPKLLINSGYLCLLEASIRGWYKEQAEQTPSPSDEPTENSGVNQGTLASPR